MCDKVCSPLGSKMFYIWQKQRLKMIWYTHKKHNEPVLCFILHLLENSLIHSLHHSHALSLMLDRFQTNNMLTCSHQLLYNNLAWHIILFNTVNGKYQKSKEIATDSNYLKCHALLAAIHFPLDHTSLG